MKRSNICFVSYLDQDNLGVGYIASSLLQTDRFDIVLIDIKEDTSVIIKNIIDADPLIVGFSIVFQAHLDIFQNLIVKLRKNNIKCHFTAGGHYPSLRFEELMHIVPELDSVVLFEGENTTVELATAIQNNNEWRDIDGIAWRKDSSIVQNKLRPLENDLDRYPLPVRRRIRPMILDQKTINLIAGRGCIYQCSFCSIHQFYSRPPGKKKRIRSPEIVVREMSYHFEQEGCTIFLFQDDDFPLVSSKKSPWIEEYCRHLQDQNLSSRIMWKISCRSNEIDEKTIPTLKSHGLGMVYLGIESGTSEGLNSMNKKLTPEDNIKATKVLKEQRLPFEFGFMMFEPDSTFQSVEENVKFLDQICGDGSASIGIAKMLALAGTDIEHILRSQNRLIGQPPLEDYRFLDPRLDTCYEMLSIAFGSWMHDSSGFFSLSRWVRLQVEAFRRFYDNQAAAEEAKENLWEVVSSANQYLLDAVVSTADLAKSGLDRASSYNETIMLTTERHTRLLEQLASVSTTIDRLAGIRH